MLDTVMQDPKASFPHMLFLSGSKDTLVPPSHMKQLHGLANDVRAIQPDKQIVLQIFEGCNHVDTCLHPDYFPAIVQFLKRVSE